MRVTHATYKAIYGPRFIQSNNEHCTTARHYAISRCKTWQPEYIEDNLSTLINDSITSHSKQPSKSYNRGFSTLVPSEDPHRCMRAPTATALLSKSLQDFASIYVVCFLLVLNDTCIGYTPLTIKMTFLNLYYILNKIVVFIPYVYVCRNKVLIDGKHLLL